METTKRYKPCQGVKVEFNIPGAVQRMKLEESSSQRVVRTRTGTEAERRWKDVDGGTICSTKFVVPKHSTNAFISLFHPKLLTSSTHLYLCCCCCFKPSSRHHKFIQVFVFILVFVSTPCGGYSGGGGGGDCRLARCTTHYRRR